MKVFELFYILAILDGVFTKRGVAMAIKYQIDPEMGVIYVNLAGKVCDDEFSAALDQALRDPDYHVGMSGLIDFRAVERFDVSTRVIREAVTTIAKTMNGFKYPWRTAIVAPTDMVYGLSRMYQILREGSMEEVGVFRDAGDAGKWLGLPEDGSG